MSIENIGTSCCGCRACLQKCKIGAISFSVDRYGFEYPTINPNLCIHCGLCENVCPIQQKQMTSNDVFACGFAYAKNAEIKYQGSSGGLFGVFAKNVIMNGGSVYGAAFDENLKLKTTKAETEAALYPLYKSKYLLCDTNFQFAEIEKDLQLGKPVLYCSSPCQITALKLYLKKDYGNLLAIDFICHGVGSQTLFDRSISYMEQKSNIKINSVTLRYKKAKASSHYYYLRYSKNGKKYEKSDLYFSFPYYNAYCKQLACRDSCYHCKYATKERVGDITIGDFHSIEKYAPKIDRFAGVSMFLVNTINGKSWFDRVADQIHYEHIEKTVLYQNNRFSKEADIPCQYTAFRESIAEEPFKITVKRFLKPSKDWKKLLYYKAPKFIRNLARKFQ